MDAGPDALPDDPDAPKAALIEARAETAALRARQSRDQALIGHLKRPIEKLYPERFGPRSESHPQPICATSDVREERLR